MPRLAPVLALLALAACSDPGSEPDVYGPAADGPSVGTLEASDPPETTAEGVAPLDAGDAVPDPVRAETDWARTYAFREGGGLYTYDYRLALETAGPEAPDQYVGTLDVSGPQVTKHYEVLGEPTDRGLAVVLIGYREGNANELTPPGTRLFELRWDDADDLGDEAGDRVLKTYWDALTPTGAGDASPDAEWSLAFSPAG